MIASTPWILVCLFGFTAVCWAQQHCLECFIKTGNYDLINLPRNNQTDLILTQIWTNLGQPDESLEACSVSPNCMKSLLYQYLARYKQDCTGDGIIDCLDYSLIVRHGSMCKYTIREEASLLTGLIEKGGCSNIGRDNSTDESIDKSSLNQSNQESSTKTSVDLEESSTKALIEDDGSSLMNVEADNRLAANLIDSQCLKCICQASSDCDPNGSCDEHHCGPYLISPEYYELAGRPGAGYRNCSRDKTCSEVAVQAYVAKFLRDCDGNGLIDCDDFAAIHRFGNHCQENHLRSTNYWYHFEYCTVMADNVRREQDPWENTPRPSNNRPSLSLPPLVPFPVRFSYKTESPIQPTDRLFNQIISLDDNCLNCICEASSGCNITRTRCSGEEGCGPYHIDLKYMENAGEVDHVKEGFDDCANSKECSEGVVRNYIEKNAIDCNRDETLDCLDFAMIHRFGVRKCGQTKELEGFMDSRYWIDFQFCYGFD